MQGGSSFEISEIKSRLTIQCTYFLDPTEQRFPVALFLVLPLYRLMLTFGSLDEMLTHGHSNPRNSFLRTVPTNSKVFSRRLRVCGKSRY